MGAIRVIERRDFDGLLAALARRGYTIVGPTIRDEAIVCDEIGAVADLPAVEAVAPVLADAVLREAVKLAED
jgi:hypothetical protein